MFLFRIGKEKLSFTLSMALGKVRYSDLRDLVPDNQIKVEINRYSQGNTDRGSHELKFIAAVNKRGRVISQAHPQTIPLTLYYDLDTRQFNAKDLVVQAAVYDDLNERIVDLGETELDIAQYARVEGSEQFTLEVELEGIRKQVCKVQFEVNITRCKGIVQEQSETVSQPKTENLEEAEKARRKASMAASNCSKKEIQSEGVARNKKMAFNMGHNTAKRETRQWHQNNMMFELSSQENQTEREKSIEYQQPPSEDNDTVILNRQTPHLRNKQGEEESVSLRLFETEKALKMREKELARTRKELKDQTTINQVLLEQQKHEVKHKESRHLTKQIENLQTQLEVADMKISHLEGDNRTHLEQLRQSETEAEAMRQQAHFYRKTLEKEKMRVAELIQKALDSGDMELMMFVESLISEER